jgi:uncharacterized protein YciI
MLFAVICTDRPGVLERRLAARPAHLQYLEGQVQHLIEAGAMLDPNGQPVGSLFVVDMPDRAAVEAFASGDPYAAAGVFESTVIRPFRSVFKDRARVT